METNYTSVMFKRFKIIPAFISFLICLMTCNTFAAEILITVKYPDGKPAKGIKVREVGLGNGNMKNELVGVTDDSGRIKTQIELEPSETEQKKDLQKYPQGSYYEYAYRYVVMPDNYRWEVSDIYWSTYPEAEADSYPKGFYTHAENWSIGKQIRLSQKSSINWTVILRKGPSFRVRLEDQHGKPIKKKQVSVFLDLQARSHTTRGGEIAMFESYTDDQGYITVHNADNYYYSFDLLNQNQYTTPGLDYSSTVVMKKLQGRGDKVIYHKCIENEIVIIVRDKVTGKPIQAAYIVGSEEFLTGTLPLRGQLGPDALTDVNGIYKSNNFCTEHMVEFGAYKEGYKPDLISIHKFVSGNTYEFLLEPESKKDPINRKTGVQQKNRGDRE